MTTNPDPMAGTPVGTVGGFRGDGALRAASKKLMTPHGRFFLWYSLALVLFGPFGFAIGPLVAHFLKRRAERKHPQAAYDARQRDTGFNWGQWVVLTILTLWGAGGLMALAQAIPMWILVMMGTRVG